MISYVQTIGDRTGTVSGTVSARNNIGSFRLRNIFFRSWNMLSIYSVLSETLRQSHLVHTLLCSYLYGLGTATVGSFDLYKQYSTPIYSCWPLQV